MSKEDKYMVVINDSQLSAPCPHKNCNGIIFLGYQLNKQFSQSPHGKCCLCGKEVLIRGSRKKRRLQNIVRAAKGIINDPIAHAHEL